MRRKKYKDEIRNKVAKVRINDTEFLEFDNAAKSLNMDKTEIIREAVKEYLANRDICIWEN